MARSVENSSAGIPGSPDNEGWRHFGDGVAGRIHAARIQGYDPVSLGYVDVQVDTNGVVQTAGGGSGGGGAVTVADGADVAQGTTSDIAWVSGAGSMIAISKTEVAKLEAIRAQLAASIAVTGPLTDTQLRASAVPVSLATLPTVAFSSPQHVIVDSASLGTVTVAEHTVDQGAAGSQSWKVDGSAVTQPVSATVLPLPASASTDASVQATTAAVREGVFMAWLAREETLFA